MDCPESHLECDSLCSYRQDDKCYSPYWGKPESIYNLMSHEELIREIKKSVRQPEWDQKQWDIVEQYVNRTRYLESKILQLRVELEAELQAKIKQVYSDLGVIPKEERAKIKQIQQKGVLP